MQMVWSLVEWVAWVFGIAAIAVWTVVTLAGVAASREDLTRFEQQRSAVARSVVPTAAAPDVSEWDVERVKAWRAVLTDPAPAPLAILRIPKIKLEVAILPGTDEFVLNRAVGHIEETVLPGAVGNAGIAGHRDGFFRGLKDIATGDAIDVETLRGRHTYRVERIWIVNPEDVSVLDELPTRALTLVTCYPFFHIGPAPQRYIVRAVSAERERTP